VLFFETVLIACLTIGRFIYYMKYYVQMLEPGK